LRGGRQGHGKTTLGETMVTAVTTTIASHCCRHHRAKLHDRSSYNNGPKRNNIERVQQHVAFPGNGDADMGKWLLWLSKNLRQQRNKINTELIITVLLFYNTCVKK
jgi:hypothetical protein